MRKLYHADFPDTRICEWDSVKTFSGNVDGDYTHGISYVACNHSGTSLYTAWYVSKENEIAMSK